MTQPDFNTLEALPGHPQYRNVGGTWMDREQYQVEGWHIARTYEREDGTKGHYWVARLDGLIRYGRLSHDRREQRFAEARNRREAEDQWTREVERMIEGAE